MRVEIRAIPGDLVECKQILGDNIFACEWQSVLTRSEWVNCRDGLIIYKEIKKDEQKKILAVQSRQKRKRRAGGDVKNRGSKSGKQIKKIDR